MLLLFALWEGGAVLLFDEGVGDGKGEVALGFWFGWDGGIELEELAEGI